MPYRKSRGEHDSSEGETPWIVRRNTIRKLGMIIDVFQGEVRFNGKIVKCGTGSNEHMRIKLRKKK